MQKGPKKKYLLKWSFDHDRMRNERGKISEISNFFRKPPKSVPNTFVEFLVGSWKVFFKESNFSRKYTYTTIQWREFVADLTFRAPLCHSVWAGEALYLRRLRMWTTCVHNNLIGMAPEMSMESSQLYCKVSFRSPMHIFIHTHEH